MQMLGLILLVVEAQPSSLMQLFQQRHRRLTGQQLGVEAALDNLTWRRICAISLSKLEQISGYDSIMVQSVKL